MGLQEVNPDISGGVNILIDPDFFEGKGIDKLLEGVYSFTLSATKPDGSNNTQSVCVPLTCQAWCRAVQRLAENPEHYEIAYKMLKVLDYVEDCDQCDCKYGCTIYDKVIEILNDDVRNDPCNCK